MEVNQPRQSVVPRATAAPTATQSPKDHQATASPQSANQSQRVSTPSTGAIPKVPRTPVQAPRQSRSTMYPSVLSSTSDSLPPLPQDRGHFRLDPQMADLRSSFAATYGLGQPVCLPPPDPLTHSNRPRVDPVAIPQYKSWADFFCPCGFAATP